MMKIMSKLILRLCNNTLHEIRDRVNDVRTQGNLPVLLYTVSITVPDADHYIYVPKSLLVGTYAREDWKGKVGSSLELGVIGMSLELFNISRDSVCMQIPGQFCEITSDDRPLSNHKHHIFLRYHDFEGGAKGI